MDLTRFPRTALARLPTPIEPLPRLSAYLGGPRLCVKRDDLTGLGLGGNKLRKLEFLLGEAQAQGADTVLTVAKAKETQAKTLEVLSGIDLAERQHALDAVISLGEAFNAQQDLQEPAPPVANGA